MLSCLVAASAMTWCDPVATSQGVLPGHSIPVPVAVDPRRAARPPHATAGYQPGGNVQMASPAGLASFSP